MFRRFDIFDETQTSLASTRKKSRQSADLQAGTTAAAVTLGALFRAREHGVGEHIDLSVQAVVASILEDQATGPGSFRYKGIANVFDSLPTEFLFTATREAIAEMVDLVFEAEQQQEVGVTFLMNGQDSAFCLAAMPKTQFSDELRREVEQEIGRTLKATYTDHGLFVGRYDTILLHYYLTGINNPGDEAISALTQRIRQLATPWVARLWEALSATFGEARADRLPARLPGRRFRQARSVVRVAQDKDPDRQDVAGGCEHPGDQPGDEQPAHGRLGEDSVEDQAEAWRDHYGQRAYDREQRRDTSRHPLVEER